MCYVCWKEQNPQTRRGRIAQQPKTVVIKRERPKRKQIPVRLPCIHLGEISYAPANCKKGKEIYHCTNDANEASRCTIGSNCGKDKDVASCAKCGLYVAVVTD